MTKEASEKRVKIAWCSALVVPPLVARVTGPVGKRIVAYRIQQIFFKPAVWIVAHHTRIRARHDLLMGVDETGSLFTMTACAEWPDR